MATKKATAKKAPAKKKAPVKKATAKKAPAKKKAPVKKAAAKKAPVKKTVTDDILGKAAVQVRRGMSKDAVSMLVKEAEITEAAAHKIVFKLQNG